MSALLLLILPINHKRYLFPVGGFLSTIGHMEMKCLYFLSVDFLIYIYLILFKIYIFIVTLVANKSK